MQKNFKSILLVCGSLVMGTSTSVEAALAGNAVLHFDDPVYNAIGQIVGGSNFAMDYNDNGFIEINERNAITENDGLKIGTAQAATLTSPGIDTPWQFFGNPGFHETTSAVNILSDDGAGNVTLDFSGLSVIWNGINIDLGGAAWGSNASGVAELTCASDCSTGDSYSLFYTAQVTQGPFLGVRYRLGFDSGTVAETLFGEELIGEDLGILSTGTIGASAVPVPAAVWLFGSGLIGLIGIARRKK